MTAHLRLRRTLAAATISLAVVGLAACSSEDEPPPAAESQPEEAAGSGPSLDAGEQVDTTEFVDRLRTGVDASTTARMNLEATGGDLELSVEGDVDYSADPPALEATITVPGVDGLAVTILEGFAYAQLPGVTQGKYVRYDLDDPQNPLQGDFADLLDPKASFETFEAGLDSVTFVGTEDLEGTATEHFRLGVDTSRLEPETAESLPSVLEYDVWVDAEDRVRQFVIDIAGTELTTTVSDYGEPVDIQAPPKSQILENPPR